MGFHDAIAFDSLHKGIFNGGLIGDRPATPEGFGDVYWATDTTTLYTTNAAGDTWVEVSASISASSIGDLSDVTITAVADLQFLQYDNGTSQWINMTLGMSDLSDVADVTGAAKGDIIVFNGSSQLDNFPVGTDGQILTAASSETLGVEWTTAASLFDTDDILTDGDDVLVDADGNVMVLT